MDWERDKRYFAHKTVFFCEYNYNSFKSKQPSFYRLQDFVKEQGR